MPLRSVGYRDLKPLTSYRSFLQSLFPNILVSQAFFTNVKEHEADRALISQVLTTGAMLPEYQFHIIGGESPDISRS